MDKANSDLFMGIDVSTQSCKIVVIDFGKKKVIYQDSINYDEDMPQYNTEQGTIKDKGIGVSESNPKMWIEALNALFEELKGKNDGDIVSSIKSISVSGQQHGLVTLDEEGNLSRNTSKLWNDFSTQAECEILTEKIGGPEEMIKEVGNTQRTGYTAPKIFHMVRNEPEKWENTASILLVHNYVNWYLTGGKNGGVIVMEPGDTSGTALWNPKTKKWSSKVINLISEDLEDKLPPVRDSREPIGTIGKKLRKKYGFSEDCKIASGSGDNMMGAIGTGNYKKGIVTISLGTSGTAYCFMEEPYIDPDGEIAAFCDATNNYLPLLCISNMANGYEYVLNMFGLEHSEFNEIVKNTEFGNGGRIIIPWYEGERTPDIPAAAPIYFGFNINDLTTEYISRGVLEGHIFNLYDGFVKLPIKAEEIRLTGGLSKSPQWRRTIANIFDCEVVPVLGEGAALGAAIHAAWTYYPDKVIKEVAEDFIKLDENARIKPESNLVKRYEKLNKIYSALSRRARGLESEDPFTLLKDYKTEYC